MTIYTTLPLLAEARAGKKIVLRVRSLSLGFEVTNVRSHSGGIISQGGHGYSKLLISITISGEVDWSTFHRQST